MSKHYTDLTELRADVQKLNANMKDWAIEVLLDQAELIQSLAQVYVRVDTGNLRDSIRVVVRDKTVAIVAGNAQVNYAQIIEDRYLYMKPAFDSVEPSTAEKLKTEILGKL